MVGFICLYVVETTETSHWKNRAVYKPFIDKRELTLSLHGLCLHMCADLESSDWRLSMSDDLSTLLPNPIIDCSPYTHSQMIDSKIFDY